MISPDGLTLYVNNFMDRSVSAIDLLPLIGFGQTSAPTIQSLSSVGTEKLPANVLRGKQFFYDARDPRLARDSYMSCASCHNDGGHDGRTWDFTGQGEGLRNTIPLKGRAGMSEGFLHWSANFDEVQDFEGQIRSLAGGTGLMADADFNAGTRSQPLGDKKAGLSADLDALAAYLGSLSTFAPSPYRNADGTLTTAAQAGRTVFLKTNCASWSRRSRIHGKRRRHPAEEYRHAECGSRATPRRPVDRHRHPDAARRVDERAVLARRQCGHLEQRRAGSCGGDPERHGSGQCGGVCEGNRR